MSRTRLAVLVSVIVVVSVGVTLTRGGDEPSTGRVDVVFDTAKGIVPGQFVKMAGARVGRVSAVHLTSDRRARLELSIDQPHTDFRDDASCRILPEGPISENYVDCRRGSAQRPLRRNRDGVPTVPVAQTSAPVSIQDLLNVFAAPNEARIRILLNELGVATAARGEDLNDILRRGNPALEEVNRLLRQVNGHTRELTAAVTQTDAVLDELGARDADIRTFVRDAASVTRVTSDHRDDLATSLRRLPRLLDATRSGLRAVDRATTAGTPVLKSVKRSAPQLNTFVPALEEFARRGRPAILEAVKAAKDGRSLVKDARPVSRSLARFARTAGPFTGDLKRLLVSTRDRGGIESVMRIFYTLATVSSLHDGTSHLLTATLGVQPQCELESLSLPGCSHAFSAPGNGQVPINDPDVVKQRRRMLREELARRTAQKPAPAAGKAPTSSQDTPLATQAPSNAPSQPSSPATTLLDDIEGVIDGLLRPKPGSSTDPTSLLDFLLK